MVRGRARKGGAFALKIRRLTAPLSVVFLILIAGLAFTNLQARSEYPPAILDPQFDLWVANPELGGDKPLVWELEYVKGVGDQVILQKTEFSGRKALEIQIIQDGSDDMWSYVYLKQTIDGTRLRALFSRDLGVWVFPEASCTCRTVSQSESTVFGVETNDGVHTLTFVFASESIESQQFLGHRTVFLLAQKGQWAYHSINVAGEYAKAQWSYPERITFSIVVGAQGSAAGSHVAYVQGFTASAKASPVSVQQRIHARALDSSVSSEGLSANDWWAMCLHASTSIGHVFNVRSAGRVIRV